MKRKRTIAGLATVLVITLVVVLVIKYVKFDHPSEEEEVVQTDVAVHVSKVQRATLRAFIDGYGTVEPEPATGDQPAASVRLASPSAGIVAEVKCVEGQRVEKGAILFRLDSRAATGQAEKARQAVKYVEQVVVREKKLLEQENTSVRKFQEAESQLALARAELSLAETQLAILDIPAPLSGTVSQANVKPGEAVDLSTVLAEVIDLDRLVVAVSIPAQEVGGLKPGQPVELLAGKAGKVDGSVVSISPLVDSKTDAVLVRASVPPGTGLRPGQFLHLRIVSEERKDRLAVPIESVVVDGPGHGFLSLVEGDTAIRKAVAVGLRDGNLVEVQGEGVTEGATVVTTGAYGLPKETKVRVIER